LRARLVKQKTDDGLIEIGDLPLGFIFEVAWNITQSVFIYNPTKHRVARHDMVLTREPGGDWELLPIELLEQVADA
jgi:hypothetical protein